MTAFGLIAVDLCVRSAMDCLTPWLNCFWQSLEDAGAAVALTAIASAVDPVTVIQGIWSRIANWASSGYQQAPLVMVGLAALLIAPVLALAGLALRREPVARRESVTVSEDPSTVPQNAWVAVEGDPDTPRALVNQMLRIGRQDDNDLCLANKTVHRYHAIIYRSDEAQYIIMDLSGAEGNGVVVNGQMVTQSALASGDTVQLGEVRLRFEAGCP